MPIKSHTIPEIRLIMVSFNMMPAHDEGVARMAQYDLGRMKGIAKFKRALSSSNAYRVFRSQNRVVLEYLKATAPEDFQVQSRMIYELAPPFAQS